MGSHKSEWENVSIRMVMLNIIMGNYVDQVEIIKHCDGNMLPGWPILQNIEWENAFNMTIKNIR
jgi:hypothetical protein